MADGYISQIKTPDNKVYLLKDSEKGYKWNAITQGQKWSRICLITPTITTEGSSGILSVSCTRGSVVCNATFLITTSHASRCFINTLGTTLYTSVRIRGVVQSNGTAYIELYDTARSIASGTAQTWHCSYIPILSSTVTPYTAFTDGTTLPSGYTAVNDFTAPQGDDSAPVVSISRNGTTFTATRSNGTTFDFTQQDNNTTYSAGTGLALDGTKFNHSNSVTAKTSYVDTATTASANGGKIKVTDIKYDAQGHVTGSQDRTITLSQTTYSLSGLGGIGTISASGTAPLTLSGSKSGTTYTLTGSIADASASASGVVNTDAQVFGGIKTFMNGIEIKGHIAGDSSTTTGHGLYGGGMYHNAYNNIILHGDASTGSSGIAFVSDKVSANGTITNRNAPSDRAFIQYHACGVTTATAEGTNPTLASGSEEAGRLVIGIGNDSGDKIILQAPGDTDIVHQKGATGYPIPHTTNTNGSVGGTTTPVYVDAGVIKALSYTIAKSVPADAVFTDHYAWGDITGKPTKIILTGAVTGNVSLGAGDLTLSTSVNHNHNSSYLTAVGYDTTNKKIYYTKNGSNTDIVTVATLRTDMGLSNALHFIGITSTALSDGSTTATLTAKSTNSLTKTTGFVDGDVVMDGDQLREYVWSGSAWRLLGITTSTAYTQPASTATNTWIAQVSQGTDGKITATTGSLNTSGTWNGNAGTASKLLGFSASGTSNASWGNQTGTQVCWANDSSGGSYSFRRDNPSSGKLSLEVDGRFYGNEGNNPAMLMSDPNNTSYWGMGSPDGANNVWIRTTSLGIIPFQSGGASAGHGGIGTSSWYFASSYIQNMYGTHTGNVVTSSITHRDGGNIDNGSWITGSTGTAPTATTTDGTTTYSGAVVGTSILTLGNNKVGANSASGVANNAQGILRLYSTGSAYGELTGYTTSARTHIHASTGISLPENIIDIMFRPGSGSYYTHIAYETSGNEALVAATQNAVTSFIFVNGESYANVAADRWTKLTGASGAGNAPGLQIKQNCVSIGELIPSGTNATYKLNVNGTSNFKGNMTSTGNFYTSGRHISLISGAETDQFIDFAYAADPTVSTAPGASWRIGALNSGSGDGNYFVIQTGGSATNATTWNNALRLGMNTYDAGFGGNVYPLTNNNKTLGTASLKWSNVYATTFTGNLTGNATSADSAKWLMNRGGSTVTISDGPWAHGQAGYGGTNAATVWHQRWKQSGLTYTPSGGSATTLTDSGDMVLWLAQSATSNALTVNMAIDGLIYAMGGFKGNLNGQASTVARATFGDSGNGEHNANNIKSNGLWYYTSNGPATTLGASTGDGAIYSQAYSTSWAGQIAQDYRDGALFVRGLNSGTWKNWYAIPKFTTTTGGLGSVTQPVYIDTNGELQVCTAYGSASVNYATSSGSCTGNAATATKFKDNAGNTTKVFYRGDNTWSNILKQTAASALGIDTNHKIGTAIKDLHFTVGSGSGTGINDGNAGGITIGTDTSSYGGIYWQSSGSYGLRLHFATTGSFANGAYTRMLITSDGKVGIGTLTPDTLLTVNGNAKADKFIGALQGNADTATSAGKWTTARTLTIGNTGKSVDGSGNVSWSLAEIGAAPAVTGGYLPLSGGTLTGALTTANNTWNTIGDDAYLGDINKAGHIGIQGKNGNTGIFFTTYNQTTKTTGGAITWDGTKFSITSTTAVDASISGNAATATGISKTGGSTANFWRGDNKWANSLTDQLLIYNSTTTRGDSYSGGIQLREFNSQTTNCELNWYNAPGITFHWGGRWVNKLGIYTGGDLFWGGYKVLHAGNTAAGTDNNKTLAWGTAYTIAKINGTDIKFTTMAKPSYTASDVGALANTTKYAASSSVGGAATYAATTANTTDSIYPVGVKSGATTTLLHDTSITMKGGAISATTYTVNSHVTLQYNTTDSSLDFIFT